MKQLLFPRPVARFLDRTPMYRVVTLTLLCLAVISVSLGTVGLMFYGAVSQLLSLTVALVVGVGFNIILAKLLRIPANHESAVITALILFFLFTPAQQLVDHYLIAVAVAAGVASKFFIAPRRQHIFNAAAFGAVVLSLPGWHEAWWWIASPEMFIPLLIAGVLVVTKVRRWPMVVAFIGVGALVYMVESVTLFNDELSTAVWRYAVTGPSLFLAFYMLTEPFTTPPTRWLQIAYGVTVGLIANTTLLMPVVAMTPELALLIGNLVFYPFTLRQKLYLPLQERRPIAADTYEYTFTAPTNVTWQPGQYLEWMLPHQESDKRGQRRYFTIASAPAEGSMKLAVRELPSGGSTYKSALAQLQPGREIIASQLAGDFLLPEDASVPMGWIAGGIGVTPFRSFVGHISARNETRDAILFYCNKTEADIAYRKTFAAASEHGLTTVHVLEEAPTDDYETGYITKEMLERQAPDYLERVWYLSGPPGMVNAYESLLRDLGVPGSQIVKDFFPGLG